MAENVPYTALDLPGTASIFRSIDFLEHLDGRYVPEWARKNVLRSRDADQQFVSHSLPGRTWGGIHVIVDKNRKGNVHIILHIAQQAVPSRRNTFATVVFFEIKNMHEERMRYGQVGNAF